MEAWKEFLTANRTRKDLPVLNPGDSIDVHYKVVEGDKERVQVFSGIVINERGSSTDATFIVRRVSSGSIGVERIFLRNSPFISEIVVKRRAKVRRSKLFYLRNLRGKASRLKESKEQVQTHTAE